jgi:hypothetical protein
MAARNRPVRAPHPSEAAKTGTKSGTETTPSSAPGVMISPVNGAVCPTGAHPLNTGGKPGRSGRPPSLVRDALREAFEQRIPVLASIADGEPAVRTRVALADILPHVVCPTCGDQLEPREPTDAVREIAVVTGANPKDRVQAVDVMGKYGLGTMKEVSTETVRTKVGETIDLIRQHCSPELAARIILAMRSVWTT